MSKEVFEVENVFTTKRTKRSASTLFQTFIALILFRSIRRMEVNFSGFKFENLYQILEQEIRCLVNTYPIKLKLGRVLRRIRVANSPTIKLCADVFSFQSCSSLKCFSGKVYSAQVLL